MRNLLDYDKNTLEQLVRSIRPDVVEILPIISNQEVTIAAVSQFGHRVYEKIVACAIHNEYQNLVRQGKQSDTE